MKKYLFIAALGLSLVSTSCTDFLDTKPYDKITGDQTWTSEELTKSFVYSIYNSVMQKAYGWALMGILTAAVPKAQQKMQ